MKYIIMCGTSDTSLFPDKPRQLCSINNEVIVSRTIRLLKECGVKNISITSNDDSFSNLGVPLIKYDSSGLWINCFYNTHEPTCYIFGDVYYSYSAILKIVSTKTNDIEFFASSNPSIKKWNEPFAFKVTDMSRFFECVEITRELYNAKKLRRCIAWELWQVIKDTTLNVLDYTNYIAINDYTCDLDKPEDIKSIESHLCNQNILIHSVYERHWYVYDFIIPSLEKQGICNISVYTDYKRLGNLKSCMDSFNSLPNEGYTWHLQDDTIISNSFTKSIESVNTDIVCGFGSNCDRFGPGLVTPAKMWYSFPCIKIPNKIARNFSEWCNNKSNINSEKLLNYIKENRYDDSLFKEYLIMNYPDIKVYNLSPNIVNHIDWMIGGSVANEDRNKTKITSRFWKENELIKDLENRLQSISKYDKVVEKDIDLRNRVLTKLSTEMKSNKNHDVTLESAKEYMKIFGLEEPPDTDPFRKICYKSVLRSLNNIKK